jgi:hypothetical protein
LLVLVGFLAGASEIGFLTLAKLRMLADQWPKLPENPVAPKVL